MKKFKYRTRENSYITVVKVDEPYGEGSESVLSVGCTLKGDVDNPTWKVHIPMHLAREVASELLYMTDVVHFDKE
tara:strand:- start:248 stop:472 length:225 start_codon:yes stop_codon:yes gene_type:complete